jgi:hypothetical protein
MSTDFAPLAGPYRRKRRPLLIRVARNALVLLLDIARWLLQTRP